MAKVLNILMLEFKSLDLFKAPNSTSYNFSIEKQGPEKMHHVPRIFIHSGSHYRTSKSHEFWIQNQPHIQCSELGEKSLRHPIPLLVV